MAKKINTKKKIDGVPSWNLILVAVILGIILFIPRSLKKLISLFGIGSADGEDLPSHNRSTNYRSDKEGKQTPQDFEAKQKANILLEYMDGIGFKNYEGLVDLLYSFRYDLARISDAFGKQDLDLLGDRQATLSEWVHSYLNDSYGNWADYEKYEWADLDKSYIQVATEIFRNAGLTF